MQRKTRSGSSDTAPWRTSSAPSRRSAVTHWRSSPGPPSERGYPERLRSVDHRTWLRPAQQAETAPPRFAARGLSGTAAPVARPKQTDYPNIPTTTADCPSTETPRWSHSRADQPGFQPVQPQRSRSMPASHVPSNPPNQAPWQPFSTQWKFDDLMASRSSNRTCQSFRTLPPRKYASGILPPFSPRSAFG